MRPSARFSSVELSMIRQIAALATSRSINLGLGEPNIEPDEEFRELARIAATNTTFHYTANAGMLSLRELISESEAGSIFDPATEVCVTHGTEEALYAVMQAFIDPGDEVLIPDPGFVAYETLVGLAGGVSVRYPLDPQSWSFSVDQIVEKITDRTKAVLVNSPSNPTGAVASEEVLASLAHALERRGIMVISDEVYRRIYYGQPPASMNALGANVVTLGGMSKSHAMTGLRLGWVLAAEPLMKTVVKAHQYIATCASAFSQTLAELILKSPEWNSRWLSRTREQFATQRAAALRGVEELLDVTVQPPGGAFYLFVPVPACSSLQLARKLATEAEVLTIPGYAFGEGGEGFLRISYAASPEDIGEGLRRIAGMLRALDRSKDETK